MADPARNAMVWTPINLILFLILQIAFCKLVVLSTPFLPLPSTSPTKTYAESSNFHTSSAAISLLPLLIPCVWQNAGSVIAVNPKYRRWQRLCPFTCVLDVLFAVLQLLKFLKSGLGFRGAVHELWVARLILMNPDSWEGGHLSHDRIKEIMSEEGWIESFEKHIIFRVFTGGLAIISYSKIWGVKGILYLQFLATAYFVCWIFFESLSIFAGLHGIESLARLDLQRLASHNSHHWGIELPESLKLPEFLNLHPNRYWVSIFTGLEDLGSNILELQEYTTSVFLLVLLLYLLFAAYGFFFYTCNYLIRKYFHRKPRIPCLVLVLSVSKFLVIYFVMVYSAKETEKAGWIEYLG